MSRKKELKTEDINKILEINRIIHEPARLLILKYLETLEYCDFTFLMKSTGLTKGNLSSHIRKLEDTELIIVEKTIVNRKSNIVFKISKLGLDEMSKYKKNIKMVLEY